VRWEIVFPCRDDRLRLVRRCKLTYFGSHGDHGSVAKRSRPVSLMVFRSNTRISLAPSISTNTATRPDEPAIDTMRAPFGSVMTPSVAAALPRAYIR